MKALYRFFPGNTSDSDITISCNVTAVSGYPLTNLKNPKPGMLCKLPTPSVGNYVTLYYALGAAATPIDCVFLNRINFAGFSLYYSTATTPGAWTMGNADWTLLKTVTGLTRDEIYAYDPTHPTEVDEYMHYFYDNEGDITNAKHICLVIPYQTPVFGVSSFQIGQMFVGKCVDIWSPKQGFSTSYIPKLNIIEFDSGYTDKYKLGRSKRIFNGSFDKMSSTEYNKILLTHAPFVLYVDFNLDPTQAYFVRNTKEYQRINELIALNATIPFNFEEIV